MSRCAYLLVLSLSLSLTGCGGGDSSSGGGEARSEAAAAAGGGAADTRLAGTYTGPASARVSGGGFSESASEMVQVRITDDQRVEFGEPGEAPVARGRLNSDGDRFTVRVPAAFFNQSGVECSGGLAVAGTVNDDVINGDIGGDGVACNGIPFTVSGDFNLSRVPGDTRSRAAGGLLGALRSVFARMLE